MRRLLATAVLVAFALVGSAGPALAHNVLISSDPADGATVETGPERITLTFDQYVQDAGTNEVALTGPDGGQWAEGPIEVKGNVVTAPVRPLGPAGEYTIGFRILSADGHPVAERLTFTLTQPGTGTPAAAGTTAQAPQTGTAAPAPAGDDGSGGGVPVWVWIAGAVVLLGVGLTLALRLGGGPADSGKDS
ncbi:hypothetical protein SAMN05421810_103726 [Amycolatopsis arida]|uniref:CopC domain-containing protein n=1 Tax=Amycolatopsis arida TaxID=587909 RepID=A0A1I5TZH7_9PSEU|nr:copper resistance CopC family protein [Amycolatopsis arida]TDX95899.1 hypothetical protein CLV69_10331 [Amycolatopsis arida]SFP88311.1 hypothetical protein SAMN05421810_103726 [Amycolatopsis arida]